MMRDNTQIMLFMAHLPWDYGILTGTDTGTHGMVSSGFNFSSTPLFLRWLLKQFAQHRSCGFSPPFLFGIIREAPLKMPK